MFFNTTNGFDFRTGVVLPLDLGVLNAIYKCFVADESALHQVLRNMGANGFRPCPVHYNVCKPSAARPLPPSSVDMQCVDLNLMKKHDDATVRDVLNNLRAIGVRHENGSLPVVTQDGYKEAQTSYGWHDDPNGILMDHDLNVGAILTFNALLRAHVLCVGHLQCRHAIHASFPPLPRDWRARVGRVRETLGLAKAHSPAPPYLF